MANPQTGGRGDADRLIADLHKFLRWASTCDQYIKVNDPIVADGLDFTFWADECAKHLGMLDGGIDPRIPVAADADMADDNVNGQTQKDLSASQSLMEKFMPSLKNGGGGPKK